MGFLKPEQKEFVNQFLDLASQHNEKDTLEKFILTILAFDIISKKFPNKREEWRMIGKKVTKWLKTTREAILKMEGIEEVVTRLNETETSIKNMDLGQVTMMKSKGMAMKKAF